MPELKLSKIKFLRIRTNNEQDAMYALGALLAIRIESVIGKVYEVKGGSIQTTTGYVESVIALNAELEEEAIDILRHLSTVNRLWKQKVSYETITELETEYTRALGEEFLPEHKMPR